MEGNAEPVKKDPNVHMDSFGNSITFTERGQPRAYADSRWVGTVTIDRDVLNNEDMVRYLVEQHVHEGHIFSVGVGMPWHCAQFRTLEEDPTTPKSWRFVVTRSFLD